MLRLVYSNQTEALLDALTESLQVARNHPLDEFRVVVPNRHLEAYVRYGVSERLGVAAGLQFGRLEAFLAQTLAQHHPEYRLLDHDSLLGCVLSVLLNPDLRSDPRLDPARQYIEAVENRADRGPRVYQLALRMTQLFEEYTLHRPLWLRRWRTGSSAQPADRGPTDASTERWQRALLSKALQLARTRGDRVGLRWIGLDELAFDGDTPELRLEAPLFLFGLSYWAPVYQGLFSRLGKNQAVHLFSLNPCAEFWEDVETDRELRRRLARSRRELRVGPNPLAELEDPYGLFGGEENLALRKWGVPGRESFRLLNELTDCDFEARFETPTSDHLLARLQRGILFRQPSSPHSTPKVVAGTQDCESIGFVAAGSPRREAETVVDEIWRSLGNSTDRGPKLRFNDVAIIINSRSFANYLPHLTSAAEETGLPLAVVDLPPPELEATLDLVKRLLELPFGDLTRPEVLGILTHPALNLVGEDEHNLSWAVLAEELGITSGGDRTHFAETYIDQDLLSWEQGIRRLVLGAALSDEEPGQLFEWRDEHYKPASGPTALDPARLRFGLAARSLLQFARGWSATHELPVSDWLERLEDVLVGLLGHRSEDSLAAIHMALESLNGLGIEEAISSRLATELATGAIAGLSRGQGTPLVGGVIVSSFLPMRAIPFRRTYLLGLGEGLFPAPKRRDPLDLRLGARRSGDVTAEERDRYAFLEAILSARDHLGLYWTDFASLTGETLRPSLCVQELLQMVGELTGGVGSDLIRHPPDDRSTTGARILECSPSVSPSAQLEVLAARSGDAARHDLGPLGPEILIRSGLRSTSLAPAVLRDLLDIHALPTTPPSVGSPLLVPHRRLSEFLVCPLQAWGSVLAGLRKPDQRHEEFRAEEHWTTPPIDLVVQRREAFYQCFGTGADPVQELRERLYELSLAGRSTVGTLRKLELQESHEIFVGWSEALAAVLPSPLPPSAGQGLRSRRFGPGRRGPRGRRDRQDAPLPPLDFDVTLDPAEPNEAGEPLAVSVGGATGFVSEVDGSLVYLHHRKIRKEMARQRLTEAWIDHLVLAILESPLERPRRVILGHSATNYFQCSLLPVSREQATEYLQSLLHDFVNGPHDYLLPISLASQKESPWFSLVIPERSSLESQLADLEPSEVAAGCQWGPVPQPQKYSCLSPEQAVRALERRLGPLSKLAMEAEP